MSEKNLAEVTPPSTTDSKGTKGHKGEEEKE
jgi:hypothetical protein